MAASKAAPTRASVRLHGAPNTLAALTRHSFATVLLALGCASTGNAQQAPARPEIQPHRFDEDWRPLCDPTLQTAPADRLKCIPLATPTTLTFGGELRERLEATHNPRFGLSQDSDSALLHRALIHADLRVGQSARVFVQLGYFDQSGRNGRPAPTDIDRLDVTQAFFDVNAPIAAGMGTLRLGRQELSCGSSRLLGVRDGPNARRSFDGGRAFWTGGGYRADAFYVRPVAVEPGTLDNGRVDGEAFWGAYLTGPALVAKALEFDAYYLGYERRGAAFAVDIEDERRHTLGLRLFGARSGVDWDIEGAVQLSSFAGQDIRAWTVASDVGYTFESVPLKPRLGVKADVASGDRNPRDGRLGTFNALYPKLPYFSEASLVAPANLVDVHPSLGLELASGLTVELGWNALWRYSTQDAIYTAPLTPVAGTAGRRGRFIGSQSIVNVEWQATRNVTLSGEYVHFETGTRLREAGGADVDFLTLSAAWKF